MGRYGRSSRYGAVSASVLIVGLLAYAQVAGSTAAAPAGPARFEQASVAVLPGSNCTLHPEGNSDPRQSLHVNADEDGVARFLAVRPTRPNSVTKLQLGCTVGGQHKTYTVDLRSAATFASHPFDASRTTLPVRPALTGDPSSFTQEALVKAGYGARPDPTRSPDTYRVWLTAARKPMRKLRVDRTLPMVLHREAFNLPHARVLNASVYKSLSSFWTGAIMSGAYHKSAKASQTQTYLWAIATFTVPNLFQGPTAAATMWVGLDNVCQAVVDVDTTGSSAVYGIHHQCFDPHVGHTDTAGVRFTPQPGDEISMTASYCDAAGNLNASGGYMCTFMADVTQNVQWDCTQANASATSSDCPSYKLDSGDLGNGKLGFQAEFIIENDSGEVVKGSQQWPDFGTVTMYDSAIVAKAHFVDNSSVDTSTDPTVSLQLDNSNSNRHLRITLPHSAVEWAPTVCQSNQKWDANKASCVKK